MAAITSIMELLDGQSLAAKNRIIQYVGNMLTEEVAQIRAAAQRAQAPAQ